MTTYYVDGLDGNDANAGTSEGSGNAWATIQKALDTVAAGDTVWVKASATYAEEATVVTVGAETNMIFVRGYSSTTGDDGKVTIDGTGNTHCWAKASAAYTFYVVENFIFSGATGDGFDGNCRACHIRNCDAINCGLDGFVLLYGSTATECSASGCSSDGFAAIRGTIMGCVSNDNTSMGFNAGGATVLYKAVASSNNVYGISATGDSNDSALIASVAVDGDGKQTGNGVYNNNYWPPPILDSIFYDCTTGMWQATNTDHVISRNCLVYGNTTDYSNFDSAWRVGHISGDPEFTDEASDDYTLGADSPARNAGWDPFGVSSPGEDIGAHQSQDAGGGAATTFVPVQAQSYVVIP